MAERMEKVYAGSLAVTVEIDYKTNSDKKLLKGLYIYADGNVSVEVVKNYETIFQLNDNITPSKVVAAKKKMYSIDRPARGNTYSFTLTPGASSPSSTISVFAVTE